MIVYVTHISNSTQFVRWVAVESVGMAIEVGLVLLSCSLVWDLRIKLSKKLVVMGVFATRLM